jgi:rhodanese-related sulfurtransferase
MARRLIEEEGIPEITTDRLRALIDTREGSGAAYGLDVRSEPEYEKGHVPGALSLPGGQAVQRADDFIAVRNAPIVFISNDSARASMAAYWYRQMGFSDVRVLQGGLQEWTKRGEGLDVGMPRHEPVGYEIARTSTRCIAPLQLRRQWETATGLILDVGTSLDFAAAHIPGARWISRGSIELKLPEEFPDRRQPIVVSCPDERNSVLAARALSRIGYTDVAVLAGGVRAWEAAGCATERGLGGCLVEANDVVLSPSIGGNREEMQRYLEWEMNLTRQAERIEAKG